MKKFQQTFPHPSGNVVGMVHLGALPGTPKSNQAVQQIIDAAVRETQIYAKAGVDSILIENMHDVPYLNRIAGPEVVAAMSVVGYEVKKSAAHLPVGVQVLAGANEAALGIAKASNLQYIRAEGFVFGHVADEGMMNSDAGTLLRYRKKIDAENVLVFTDIKKKHSAHSITADVDIVDTAHAAEFFLSDGVIVTGKATGAAADVTEFQHVLKGTKLPVLIGSGVDSKNLAQYISAHGLIVGSYFKTSGRWEDPVDFSVVQSFVQQASHLRSSTKPRL